MTVRETALAAALAGLLACPYALALTPALDISQYAHTAWIARDGAFNGNVQSIAQTPDGYLWLGTEFGLVRFDGIRFVPWQPPPGQHLPGKFISYLLVSRDGNLWISTDGGLATWRGGRLTSYPELAGQRVNAILEDREGTIWAGVQSSSLSKVCAIQSASVRCYGEDGSLGRTILFLYEDSRDLWVGVNSGVFRWKPGPPKFYPAVEPTALTHPRDGPLLLATARGIEQLVNGRFVPYPIPVAGSQFRPIRLLRDRDGGLWIGTQTQGLAHLHNGRTDLYAAREGLSGDFVIRLFEDREGSIWVATTDGLDRFRKPTIPTLSVKQGLSDRRVRSALAASDGSLWLGTAVGLDIWNKGQITVFGKQSGLPDDSVQSVFQDDGGQVWVSTRGGVSRYEDGRFVPVNSVPGGYVWSMAGAWANLWISSVDQGLLHLHEGSLVERISWAKFGRGLAEALLLDPSDGGLWLGFGEGGVTYYKNGQILKSYAEANGLGGGRITHLHFDHEGALWAATSGGLSRIRNGRIATLTAKNGLPCDAVHWSMEDDDHFLWLYMACGLVRISPVEIEAWVAYPNQTVHPTVLDASDGVRISSGQPVGYSPSVTKAADGGLWFVSGDGVSIIDPRHLPTNKLLPPVQIEKIVSDRETRWQNLSGAAASNVRLPPLSHDLQIDYTALSLVAPQKVRFKYKLEGHDREWTDAGSRRQAFYNDLPPRNYRFRVMASNNSGVWNEAGDTLEFSIVPAYYQTTWFLTSCVAGLLAMLAACINCACDT